MLTTGQQKNYIITAAILIVILSLVSLLNKPKPKQQNKQVQTQNSAVSSLGTVTDPSASAQIQQEIISQQQVQQDITQQLGASATVDVPVIADSALNITANSQSAVVSYLQSVDKDAKNYNYQTEDITKNLFNDSIKVSQLDDAYNATESVISELYKMPVPKDAVAFHKATINSYVAYGKLIQDAKQYNLKINTDVWKDVYANYAVINASLATANSEYQNLKQNYKLQ